MSPEEKRKANARRQKEYRLRHPERVKAARLSGKERDKAWRKANQEHINAMGRARHSRLKDELNARRKEIHDPVRAKKWRQDSYAINKEKIIIVKKAWRAANPEKCIEFARSWKERNYTAYLLRSAEFAAMRRAASKQATPKWANRFFIREVYDLAARRNKSNSCGVKWEVDHIVPLQSDFVCGLHVEHNLAVIPKIENIRKSNKHWPDMPERI